MSERPDFRLIKARVSMRDVLGKYGVEIRNVNATSGRGRCPLPTHDRDAKDATFNVDFKRNIWACHSASCVAGRNEGREKPKKGGDLIEFVACMEKCRLREAGERLTQWFGPFSDSLAGPSASPAEIPAEQVDETPANPPLGFELRGIQHKHSFLAVRGFAEEECEYLGVGFFSGKGSMQNRIVFSIHDEAGQLVAYAGRRVEYSLHDENPEHVAPVNPDLERWRFPKGFRRGQVLYNLHRVTEDDWTSVIVLESFWGVLACVRAGIMNSVAIMSNTATSAQVKLLAGFERVLICFDGDGPGRSGAVDLADKLVKAEASRVELCILRDDEQPDHLPADVLRRRLGIPPERDGSLEVVGDAQPSDIAVPA
jgi:DNA primase